MPQTLSFGGLLQATVAGFVPAVVSKKFPRDDVRDRTVNALMNAAAGGVQRQPVRASGR